MPLFDFRCNSCSNTFEALCRNGAESSVKCPSCGKSRLSRLISRFAVSQNLTPCGSNASEAAQSCGYNPAIGGCGRCMPN